MLLHAMGENLQQFIHMYTIATWTTCWCFADVYNRDMYKPMLLCN